MLNEKPLGKHSDARPTRRCKIVFWEADCEDRKWMELTQDRVQWQALILVMLNLIGFAVTVLIV